MMAAQVSAGASRRSRTLAAIGCVLGVAWVLLLVAYGIRDSLRHPDGWPIFGIVYGALLLAPFVVGLAALTKKAGRTPARVWGISGVIASVLATFSPGLVAAPLVLPAGLLLVAAATVGNE